MIGGHRLTYTGALICIVANALVSLVAISARAEGVGRFDGSYRGLPVADPSNKWPPCGSPQSQILDVKDGHAKLRSVVDTRQGTVETDGHLLMVGEQVYGSNHIKAEVEGRFSGAMFDGTSRLPDLRCVYHWTLQKL